MKYVAHFSDYCPFANYYHMTDAGSKSWIRVFNYIEYALGKYHLFNGLYCNHPDKGTHPKYIWRTHCELFDNPQDDKIVTYMVFETEDKKKNYVVYITEEK